MNSYRPVCSYYLQGKCKYGDRCKNYHPPNINLNTNNNQGPAPIPVNAGGNNAPVSFSNQNDRNLIEPPDKRICIFFYNGQCKKGNRCEHRHVFSINLENVQRETGHNTEITQIAQFNNDYFITCNDSSFKLWTLSPNFHSVKEETIEGKICKLVVSNQKMIIASQIEKMYGNYSNLSFQISDYFKI